MTTLSELNGTIWAGVNELWLDPLGDSVVKSPCRITIDGTHVHYTWSHEGKEHKGSIALSPAGASFVDSFHSPEPMTCRPLAGAPGLFQVQGEYGEQRDWGWRIGVSYREPMSQLVLQMTNIAPWGEEARAVRMTCDRK